MISLLFLEDAGWDAPFFKKLAANDTGSASGHQGGLVIPKDIREYFPTLEGVISESSPTIDYQIKVILIADGQYLSTTSTRYQFQTWGGTRSPESRLTGNLGPLRNIAKVGDYLIFQRSLEHLGFYRLILVTKQNKDYSICESIANKRRWGIFGDEPLSQKDITSCHQEEELRESSDFQLFDTRLKREEKRVKKTAREIVFRSIIQKIYENSCSVCGTSLESPAGPIEIEAAHIVPKSHKGTDDARNGISLCRRHHWAFDHGLFGINENRNVFIPEIVLRYRKNEPLLEYQDRQIIEANKRELRARQEAFIWHSENIVIRNNV